MKKPRKSTLIATSALLALSLAAGSAFADLTTWTATLDGSASVPPSSATGTATIVADSDLQGLPGYLTIHAEYVGLSGPITSADLYDGDPSSGGTFIWSVGTDNPLDGNLILPLGPYAMLAGALINETLYLNVATGGAKSLDYPEGEIKGQFTLTGTVADEATTWGGVKALYR